MGGGGETGLKSRKLSINRFRGWGGVPGFERGWGRGSVVSMGKVRVVLQRTVIGD